jgi:hypothetical protein
MMALSMLLCFAICAPPAARAANQYMLVVNSGVGGSAQIMATYGGTAMAWGGAVSTLLTEGTEVTVTAVANPGWHFVHWIGTVGSNTVTLSFTLTSNWTLQAVFEPDQPTLVVTSGKGGTVIKPGLGSFSYAAGTKTVVQAQADSGYRFAEWTGSAVDAGKVADPTAASTFVSMDGNYSLQANFEARGLTLNVSSGVGGSVITPGLGDFTYLNGAVIVISARAEGDYHFAGWTGSAVDALKVADPTAATTTVTVDDDYTVRATFARDEHTLIIAWSAGGSVETTTVVNDTRTTWTSQGSFAIADGASVQLTARADAGWHFTSWSGAPEASDNTVTFTMTEDRNIQAYFAQDARTLVITSGVGGTVTQPGLGTFSYERGTVVAIEAVANTGYRFTRWTGTVVDAGNVGDPQLSQTGVTVDESGTLQANFEVLAQDVSETWQTAPTGVFTPSKSTFISGDEGFWAVRDGFLSSSGCGPTPQRATVLTLDDDHALMLTSVNSGSTCSDRVSVLLGASNSPVPWPGVSITTNTVISFDEVGKLCDAALHAADTDSLVLPCYDNISLILTDNNRNTLVYVLQRYTGAVPNLGNASSDDTYREIFVSTTAIKYQRSLFYDFLSIPAFKPSDAKLTSVEFRVDAHGSAIIDNIIIGPGTVIPKIPVYRFWSPSSQDHLYTASETERQKVSDPRHGDWVAEGIAYFALPSGGDPNTKPVYRFYSPVLDSHFYTISESEKNKLLTRFADSWIFEGVFFYAYDEDHRPADAVPVYRFWSDVLRDHFYTTSEPERDKVINMNPQIWTSEGIAWYAYKPWAYTSVLDAQPCSQ